MRNKTTWFSMSLGLWQFSAVRVVEPYSVSTFRDKLKWDCERCLNVCPGSAMQSSKLPIKLDSLQEYRPSFNPQIGMITVRMNPLLF